MSTLRRLKGLMLVPFVATAALSAAAAYASCAPAVAVEVAELGAMTVTGRNVIVSIADLGTLTVTGRREAAVANLGSLTVVAPRAGVQVAELGSVTVFAPSFDTRIADLGNVTVSARRDSLVTVAAARPERRSLASGGSRQSWN